VLQPRADHLYELGTTALSGPIPWASAAYHFAAEPLLLLDFSTSQ
jgi:hypothetical protein